MLKDTDEDTDSMYIYIYMILILMKIRSGSSPSFRLWRQGCHCSWCARVVCNCEATKLVAVVLECLGQVCVSNNVATLRFGDIACLSG